MTFKLKAYWTFSLHYVFHVAGLPAFQHVTLKSGKGPYLLASDIKAHDTSEYINFEIDK